MKHREYVDFDVKDPKHLKLFRDFMKNSAWGPKGCPFELEEPFISIPDMIKDKLARHFLKV